MRKSWKFYHVYSWHGLVSPRYHNDGLTVVAWKAAKTEKITFSVFALHEATTKLAILVVFWGLGAEIAQWLERRTRD